MKEQHIRDQKLLALLQTMVSDHNYSFDEGVAQYIIENISVQSLNEFANINKSSYNFKIKGNFFAQVLASEMYNIDKGNLENINTWVRLLKQKDENLVNYPTFRFEPAYHNEQCPKMAKKGLILEADFNTYFAINNLRTWMTKQNEVFLGKSFKDVNSSIVTMQLLYTQPNNTFILHNKESTEIADSIFSHIIAGKKQIVESRWHDESSFISKTLLSENMLRLISYVSDEYLFKLFNSEHVGLILKYTVKEKPDLLTRLLPIASPATWIKGWNKEKSHPQNYVDIVKLFNGIFYSAYGLNIDAETKKGMKSEHPRVNPKGIALLQKQIDYFFPTIKDMEYDKVGMCHLFNSIMRSGDTDMMKLCLKFVDMPSYNSSASKTYQSAYDRMITTLNGKSVLTNGDIECKSWKEWFSADLMNNLDSSLNTNEAVNKKMKL